MSKRIIKNYSFDHSTNHFRVNKNGKYYGCFKKENQAKRYVELLDENNWDINLRNELKQKVLSEI